MLVRMGCEVRFAEACVMRWTVPNILTVMRLAAAPGVALAFVLFDRPTADWVAFTLFILAALTDYVDGYLARVWKQESKFGAMLDPIADKALLVTIYVVLGIFEHLPTWIVMAILISWEDFIPG